MVNFGVFFTCYTEVAAVEYAINTLKTIYPDCPVYLVSDGGADYSFLKQKHSNIETLREYDSRGFIPTITKETYRTKDLQAKIKDSVSTFMDRVNRAIDYCQRDVMLIMEPDVLVRNKLMYFPEHAHLLGSRINEGLSYDLRKVVTSIPGSIDVNHWGATPALFRSDTYKIIHGLIQNDPGLLARLTESDERLANYDVLLSVLFALVGKEEVFNPEIVECLRTPFWRESWHPLVHQFREKYPKKSEGYMGRHAEEVG